MCVALCTVSIPVDFSGITDSIVKHVPKSLGYTLGYRPLVFSLFITEPFKVYFGEAQEKLIYPHCLRILDKAGRD